jgi:putative transcriptional regulator
MFSYPHFAVPNVFLRSGYELADSPYGPIASIEDVEALEHRLRLITLDQHYLLTPAQIRFLRVGMDKTQEQFAERLGVNTQTVARWEKGRSEITSIIDLSIRVIAFKAWQPERQVGAIPLNDSAVAQERLVVLEHTGADWQEAVDVVAISYPNLLGPDFESLRAFSRSAVIHSATQTGRLPFKATVIASITETIAAYEAMMSSHELNMIVMTEGVTGIIQVPDEDQFPKIGNGDVEAEERAGG